jgi:hypothetical protein
VTHLTDPVQLQSQKPSINRGSLYSIERGVDTLFAEQRVSKDKLEIEGQRILDWTRQEVLIYLIRETYERGVTDAVIRLLPERPDGNFNIVVSAVAIPNEHQRLLDRIDQLENELTVWKWRKQDYYAPVYDLVERANAKVDTEKEV